MNNEPVAYINVEERKLEWAKPTTWRTPTIAQMDKIPLYTHPVKEATTRQQADRIAKLDSYLEAYKTRVAELELQLFKVTNRIIATRKKLSKLKKASEK
jgi:predicted  nucleic acid-binding Zn-ribbon protein